MCDLKTAFFRFRRWAGKVLRPQADEKPSSGMKEPFRRSVAHAYSLRGKGKSFLPKYIPLSRSENHLFSYTRLDGQKGQY